MKIYVVVAVLAGVVGSDCIPMTISVQGFKDDNMAKKAPAPPDPKLLKGLGFNPRGLLTMRWSPHPS